MTDSSSRKSPQMPAADDTLQDAVRRYYNDNDWPDELFRMGLADAVKFAAHFQRQGMLRAAETANAWADSARAIIAKGKGTWPKPDYVKDDDWLRYQERIYTCESIAAAIRAEAGEPGDQK